MKVWYKTETGSELKEDVAHIMPLSSPERAGIHLKDGTNIMIDWKDILKIWAHD